MSMGGEESDAGKTTEAMGTGSAKLGKKYIKEGIETSKAANTFAQGFYTDYVKPQVDKMNAAFDEAQANNKTITSQLLTQAADREGTYQQNKDLISNYGDTIRNFNVDQEAGRTTALAVGDLATARAANDQIVARQQGARGINPTSGAAQAGIRQAATSDAIARARIAQQERSRAEALNLQLKQSGASMGMGLANGSMPSLQGASGSTGQGAALPGVAISTANSGAALPVGSLGDLARNQLGAGQGLHAAGLGAVAQGESLNYEANKNNGSGLGAAVGTIVGGVGGFMLGGPAGAQLGASIGGSAGGMAG